MRILVAGESEADAARAEALVATCGFDGPRTRCEPWATAVELLRDGGAWDLAVLAVSGDSPALAQLDPNLPVVLLAPAYTAALAITAHRAGARVCLYDHGAAPLRHAILHAARVRTTERAQALVYLSVSDVIFDLRVEGDRYRFTRINAAFTRATGLTEDQVVGRLVDEVIPEPSLSLVLARYREAISERRTVRWEEVTEYPTGRKYGEVSVTPVVQADGRCTGLIGTVRDVTEERTAARVEAAERRALEMLADGAPLADLLAVIVGVVDEVGPVGSVASILLLDQQGLHLRHGAAPRLPDAYNRSIDGAAIGPRAGSCGTAAYLGEPVIVADLETDPLWEGYRELARPYGLRSCWSFPITGDEGRILGTFAIYGREPGLPDQETLALVARLAHVAAIAIGRRHLDDQLRALSARIEAAREEERTGIAREIHDELGQALTALKMDIAWIGRRLRDPDAIAAKIGEMTGAADEVIQAVRRISAELRPGILDDLGLAAAIEWQVEDFQRRTGIAAEVAADLGEIQLDRGLVTAVFRVFQEALTNVARHAGASNLWVRLGIEGGQLALMIADDGVGVPDGAPRGGLGLLGMRERARRLGGHLEVRRGEPSGTVVHATIPLV